MSGPTGRERQPDQAALDELGRAFADRNDDAPTRPVDPPTPPEQTSPGEAPLEATSPEQTPPGEAPLEATSPGQTPPEQTSPEQTSPGEAPLAETAPEQTPPGETPPGETPPGETPPGETPPGETPPGQAPPEQISIVEAAPPDPPAPPRIIRIDDYGGSVAIGDIVENAEPASSQRERSGGPPDQLAGEHGVGEHGAGEHEAGGVNPVVIAIDDEDLPDAVYVEGSLDGSGPRSIVFIEDDDTDDALAPESERDIRRGIEPRMRERRVAVKRAQSRKRLKWVLVAAGLVLVVVGTLAVLGSGWFAIEQDQVVVTGNVYTDPERLQAVIDDLVGTPVLVADTDAAERRLEEIPWVETARVRTEFPHGVTIEIRERQAIATYQGPDQRFRVIDRDGRVLDVIDKYPFAYVLLGGPDPVDLDAGEFAPYGYAAAADLSKNLTGSIRGRVELIEVDAAGSRLVLHLDDGVEVRFGDARDLLVKLVRLETVLSAGAASEGGVIDVSTSQVTL